MMRCVKAVSATLSGRETNGRVQHPVQWSASLRRKLRGKEREFEVRCVAGAGARMPARKAAATASGVAWHSTQLQGILAEWWVVRNVEA
jgi:hypothetical protein